MNKTILVSLLIAGLFFGLAPETGFPLTDADIATLAVDAPAANDGTAAAEPPNLGGIVTKLFLSLAVVFGLMWGAVWFARRTMPELKNKGKGAAIQIVATRSIGTRRSLMLVRVQGRTLLLGATPNSIQTLSDFESEAGSWREAAWDSGLDAAAAAPAKTKSGSESI